MNKIESRIPGTQESELIDEMQFRARLYIETADGDQYQPQCCMGVGYVRLERPVGHPAFGQYQKCPRCHPSKPQPVAEPERQEAMSWAK